MVFYYVRITKISIIKSSSDIDNKELLPVSSSSYFKVCISSDSDTEEGENIDTGNTKSIDSDMLEGLSSSVCKLCKRIQINIKTDFKVTGWMICVIPQIRENLIDNSDGDYSKQVKNAIKTLFCGLFEDELHVTLYVFCREYTDFNHNNGPFDGCKFI